jgi:hypothetical protein
MQLCSPKQFRQLLCGEDGAHTSLIEKNEAPFGIPQGAPISDLLANLYLMDFDQRLATYVRARGGNYYRYSDDILILVPGGEPEGNAAAVFAEEQLKNCGPQVLLSKKKTAIVEFIETASGLLSTKRVDRPTARGGLEYLGFRFDGRRVYIRESTMSKFHRGIRRAARARATQLVRRYPGKSETFLMQAFNATAFEMKFGRVADFESSLEHRRWTFRTYVKRCVEVFGDHENGFYQQMRNHRAFIRQAAEEAIRGALHHRSNGAAPTS